MATPTDVPQARPSSTVVLLRDAVRAPEIFMVKRHERSAFGSAYAFPGGVIDAADRKVHASCAGISSADANRILELESGGLDYFSAAARELFEETGVLLGPSRLSVDEQQLARTALNAGSLGWDDFVQQNRLLIPCDRLHYFSFWITPEDLPKRYSTRFFIAAMPEGQHAVHCGGELTDSRWMSAAAVLDARKEKQMRVHYPTRKTLERVAAFNSTNALCDWAQRCAERGVICDQPAHVPEALQ